MECWTYGTESVADDYKVIVTEEVRTNYNPVCILLPWWLEISLYSLFTDYLLKAHPVLCCQTLLLAVFATDSGCFL